MKKPNIATIRYETKHGTDVLVFTTDKTKLADLPPITNALITEAGGCDADVEGNNATETADWHGLYPIKDLPSV